MHKRKLTPLLVAAIITAGVATGGVAGVRSYNNLTINPEPQSSSSNIETTNISSKKEANQTQNNNAKNANKNEEQNTKNEEINSTKARKSNSTKQSFKSSAESSYIHKPMSQKQTINSNPQISKSQSSVTASSSKTSNFTATNVNDTLTLPSGNILVNGTPIKEQLQNDAQIAATANAITNGITNNYQKAEALYIWVAKNITYNSELEQQVMANDTTADGSAITTFNTRTGICENFSTLYAVMANDIGLASRVVAGKGYANGQWVDHAWNEVYIPSMGWINVDCTFANSYTALVKKYNLPFNTEGLTSSSPYYNYSTQSYNYKIYTEDYFDSANFSTSHTNGRILAQLGNS